MASIVEITAPVAANERCRGSAVKTFTPYPHMQYFREFSENNDILPFMTRAHSPVKVTFTSGTPAKLKSRVSDHSKDAIFNYRPVRIKDKCSMLNRFRVPVATMTTLNDLSPWISVTKTDYRDPRSNSRFEPNFGSEGLFRRGYTDGSIDLSVHSLSLQQPRSESSRKEANISRCQTRSNNTTDDAVNTISDKRVKITTTLVNEDMPEVNKSNEKISSFSPLKQQKLRFGNIKYPDHGVNYYSGYLSPEFSDEIVRHLETNTKEDVPEDDVVEKREQHKLIIPGQYYKPLVGDRTLFMRDSYPIMPKVYQSDINQLRFENRQRVLNSKGNAPAHFSVFKDRGNLRQRSATIDQSRAQKIIKATEPVAQSSVESFQQQRERTYYLQSQAKAMISKP